MNFMHYAWNKYKRKMITIEGVYYIDNSNVDKHNNEYLQSVIQGYDFTFIIIYMKKIIKTINIIMKNYNLMK